MHRWLPHTKCFSWGRNQAKYWNQLRERVNDLASNSFDTVQHFSFSFPRIPLNCGLNGIMIGCARSVRGGSKLNVSSAEIAFNIAPSRTLPKTKLFVYSLHAKLKDRIDFIHYYGWLCFCVSTSFQMTCGLLYDGWKCVSYIIIAPPNKSKK